MKSFTIVAKFYKGPVPLITEGEITMKPCGVIGCDNFSRKIIVLNDSGNNAVIRVCQTCFERIDPGSSNC